jgi:hypothetical protein
LSFHFANKNLVLFIFCIILLIHCAHTLVFILEVNFNFSIGRVVSSVDTNAWICPFCNGPLGTSCHIFLDCDLAKILWRSSSWPLITIGLSDKPISDWILAILYSVERLAIPKSEARKFQLFASLTLDIIWLSQNKLVHDDRHPDPAKLIIQRSSTLGFHLEAWNAASSPSLWTPPGVDGIKGNFDVAVRDSFAIAANDSFAIAATIISDSSGNIIMAATK